MTTATQTETIKQAQGPAQSQAQAPAPAPAPSQPQVRAIRGESCELRITGPLSAPTVVENPQWQWATWQVKYQKDALRKALERCLEAVANLDHVEQTVAGRAGEAEAKRASKSLARLQEQVQKQQERLQAAQAQLSKANGGKS